MCNPRKRVSYDFALKGFAGSFAELAHSASLLRNTRSATMHSEGLKASVQQFCEVSG